LRAGRVRNKHTGGAPAWDLVLKKVPLSPLWSERLQKTQDLRDYIDYERPREIAG